MNNGKTRETGWDLGEVRIVVEGKTIWKGNYEKDPEFSRHFKSACEDTLQKIFIKK